MSPAADDLYATAMSLLESERAELAARLWESLAEDPAAVEREWQEEIHAAWPPSSAAKASGTRTRT
jgi:putative addiction module component (TIGR02574 family)